MKRLQTRWRALVLALILALSLNAPALAGEAGASALEAAAYAAQYGMADSLQYALWEKGEVTLTGHVGAFSRTENRALTDGDLYGVGSVSKIYTTTAVMQLAERGKLRLDAPVTRYLKDFKMADPRYRDITVRMLLNHSSGLMGTSLQDGLLFADPDTAATDKLLERLSTQTLKADPGAYSVYCNTGFTLAELVVEAVSGMDFMAYVRKNILAPQGLENTFAPGDDFDAGRLARIYQGEDPRALPQDCLMEVGTGGIYATASDLAAFGGALTSPGLLRQSSMDATASAEYARGIWPEDTLDLVSYGLGWDCVEWYPFSQSGIQVLVKGGDTQYYHAGLLVIPEYDLAAAVVSSGGVSTYNQMAAAQILVAALADQGVTVDETVPGLPAAVPAAMPAEELKHAGYYGSNQAQYQAAITEDGVLTFRYLTDPSIPAQIFTYYDDGSFRDATGAAMLKFVTESNGQIYLYQKAVTPLPGLGALPISNYAAVKMPANDPGAAAQADWDAVGASSFVPMNEKYSSQMYLALSAQESTGTPELVPGYLGEARILDAAHARSELQVPGSAGRDGRDITLETRDGVRWLTVNSMVYMASDGVKELFTGSGWAYTTVQEDGYARWYNIGTAAAGKSMTVQVPEDAGFYVYDADGKVTASSVLWGDAAAVLPEGGTVVFAGRPGARFHLAFQAA